jgi:uncharacterized membrane protein YqjE
MSNQTNTNISNSNLVMSIGDWIITLLIMCIPLVNLIMILVWAFSGNSNPNRANFCKANLILMAIGVILWFIIIAVFGNILAHATHSTPV